MDFQAFDVQLREDVHQIQMIASHCEGASAQIGRVQSIAAAAMHCLKRLMGPAAAAHWLHIVANRIAAEANNRVH